MIATATCVGGRHSGAILNYISGESASKRHPEMVFRVEDHGLEPCQDGAGMLYAFLAHGADCNKQLEKNLIHIVLSPTKEETEGYTYDDWRNLIHDWMAKFDNTVQRDENGKVKSGRIHTQNSQWTAWVHLEADSGIPHIHLAVNRVDMAGNTINDYLIGMRAVIASEAINKERGWLSAQTISERNKKQVSDDCKKVLNDMTRWDWEDYTNQLMDMGYDVRLQIDNSGKVKGYSIKMGNSIYKSSELGVGRNLAPAKIESYWNRLHKPVSIRQEQPKETVESQYYHQNHADETVSQSSRGLATVCFEIGGNKYEKQCSTEIARIIEDSYKDLSYVDSDYADEAVNCTAALFFLPITAALASDVHACVGGGGGGTTSDLPWRDKDDDDWKWVWKCRNAVAGMIRHAPRKRKGMGI